MTLFDIEDKSVLVKDDINMVVNGLLNKRINKQKNNNQVLIIRKLSHYFYH